MATKLVYCFNCNCRHEVILPTEENPEVPNPCPECGYLVTYLWQAPVDWKPIPRKPVIDVRTIGNTVEARWARLDAQEQAYWDAYHDRHQIESETWYRRLG